jgi:hypothetical protein
MYPYTLNRQLLHNTCNTSCNIYRTTASLQYVFHYVLLFTMFSSQVLLPPACKDVVSEFGRATQAGSQLTIVFNTRNLQPTSTVMSINYQQSTNRFYGLPRSTSGQRRTTVCRDQRGKILS